VSNATPLVKRAVATVPKSARMLPADRNPTALRYRHSVRALALPTTPKPASAPHGTSRRPIRLASPALALLVLILAVVGVGCPCVQGIVNASPELRWWLFANFGAQRICPELLKSGLPLRLQNQAAAIGRFFPRECNALVQNDRQVVLVGFQGSGYAYMSPARRIGFESGGQIELRPDFMLAGDDIYVWARFNRVTAGPNFRPIFIENKTIDVAANTPPFGSIATFLGNQVVTGEISRGFTVVHNASTGTEFALGSLYPPQKPYRPWDVTGTKRYTFANETVEVHSEQRDYLGPFEVRDNKQLYVSMTVQGPPVDVFVVDKVTGDYWRTSYTSGVVGPPPGPVMNGQPVYPLYPVNLQYRLPNGLYYVVVDNSSSAGGAVAPPRSMNPFFDSAAMVSYVAQLGD
jgi:hypothetical protein